MPEWRANEPTIIKKYANRRLYHTGTSTYVTLEDLARMVKNGEDFVVTDAKTGEDITRAVLGQIIFEQEGRGQHLLPIAFLRQLIRFYGDQMQTVLPTYLESSLSAFTRNQDELREQMARALKGDALGVMEEQTRRNMEMFSEAMRMWMPFAAGGAGLDGNGEFRRARRSARSPRRARRRSTRFAASSPRCRRRWRRSPAASSRNSAGLLHHDVARGGADRHREAADEIDKRDRHQDEEGAGRRLRNDEELQQKDDEERGRQHMVDDRGRADARRLHHLQPEQQQRQEDDRPR